MASRTPHLRRRIAGAESPRRKDKKMRFARRRLALRRLLRLVGGKELLVALLMSVVMGCGPTSSQAQPGAAEQKPCAESAARLNVSLHKVRAATYSAVISVRQADQTQVLVVDLVDGRVCSLGTWATADVNDVYVDEDQTVLVVDFEATYVVRNGVTLKGPRQAVRGVLFARQGTETRIIAYVDKRGPSQTFQSGGQFILDLTAPDQPRQLADTGGFLLGQLDDGTILFSGGVTNATLTLKAVSLDGTVTSLATVSHAFYSLELHKKPRQEVTVAVPGTEPGFYDVVTVDLASGTETKTGKVPIVSSEAPRQPSPDDAFVAQNTRETLGGVRITTPSGDEILAVHVSTLRGEVRFRGWVRR